MLARSLLSADSTEEVRIFYSYSRENADFRSLIDSVLGRFKWDVSVRTWYDGEIPAGSEWEENIFRNIDAADIILLFITESFLASPYCKDVEVPRALERHHKGEAIVIPVLVEGAGPEELDPALARLQVLPHNGLPVNMWAEKDKAIRNVVHGIVDIIANAKLDPEGRSRWQIRLGSAQVLLDDQQLLNAVEELRALAEDPTLRPRAQGEEGAFLLFESSRAGLMTFKRWNEEQAEPKILGLDLLDIVELFGAGVQASVKEVDEEHSIVEVDADLLLFPSKRFEPVLMDGITLSDDRPLNPDYMIGRGDLDSEDAAFTARALRLIDYFLTTVAVPEAEIWVNLSPDESNRMLGRRLAGTVLGKQLLEIDLRLKRLAASLMHPDCDTGREFWKDVFDRSRDLDNFDHREFATFQRVWIVPRSTTVYETKKREGKRSAIVIDKYNKIMCEDDYLSKYMNNGARVSSETNTICTAAFKDIILPVIEKDVNEGANFSDCQQIYNSMILATWLKKNIDELPSWQRFVDTGNPAQLSPALLGIGSVNVKEVLGDLAQDGAQGRAPDSKAAGRAGEQARDGDAKVDDARQETLAAAVRLREAGRNEDSLTLLEGIVNSPLHNQNRDFEQNAMSQLGRTLRAMGRLEEAAQQHGEVLRLRRYMLGDDHPHTVTSMGILADTLERSGDAVAAGDLRAEIEERKARTSEAFSIRENREFYEKYMRVFRNGVFRFNRNEFRHNNTTSTRICRSYFSGAVDLRAIPLTIVR